MPLSVALGKYEMAREGARPSRQGSQNGVGDAVGSGTNVGHSLRELMGLEERLGGALGGPGRRSTRFVGLAEDVRSCAHGVLLRASEDPDDDLGPLCSPGWEVHDALPRGKRIRGFFKAKNVVLARQLEVASHDPLRESIGVSRGRHGNESELRKRNDAISGAVDLHGAEQSVVRRCRSSLCTRRIRDERADRPDRGEDDGGDGDGDAAAGSIGNKRCHSHWLRFVHRNPTVTVRPSISG